MCFGWTQKLLGKCMCLGWTQKSIGILLLVNASARRSTTQRYNKAWQPSLVLYLSLVRDSVLPLGFGEAFSRLEQPACLQLAVVRLGSVNKNKATQLTKREDRGRPVLTRSGTAHRDDFERSSRFVPRPTRQKKESGQSGSSSQVRCWRTLPHRWAHC